MPKWLWPAVIVIIIILLLAAFNFSIIELPGVEEKDDDKKDNNGDGDGDGDGNGNGNGDGNGDGNGNGYDPNLHYFREYSESAEFEFERKIVVSVTGQTTYTVRVPSPMDMSEDSVLLQDVLEVSTNPAPAEGSPSATGTSNNMLIFEDSIDGGSASIKITYKAKTVTKIWDRTYLKDNSGTTADIDQTWKDKYGGDYWAIDLNQNGVLDPDEDSNSDGNWDYRIEPTNPDIVSLSSDLTKDKTNVYEKVLAIYEHLVSNEILNYATFSSGLPKACTVTLDEKTGDCDDYSILFISLCRAADIPARLNFGMMYHPDRDEWIGHGWAEVAIPTKDGEMTFASVDIVSKQFLIRDCNRLTTWIDSGGDVSVNGKNVNNLDFYQYPYWFQGSGQKDSNELKSVSYTSTGSIKVDLTEAEVAG
jgi:transglutaminase-like putative cysteine protease